MPPSLWTDELTTGAYDTPFDAVTVWVAGLPTSVRGDSVRGDPSSLLVHFVGAITCGRHDGDRPGTQLHRPALSTLIRGAAHEMLARPVLVRGDRGECSFERARGGSTPRSSCGLTHDVTWLDSHDARTRSGPVAEQARDGDCTVERRGDSIFSILAPSRHPSRSSRLRCRCCICDGEDAVSFYELGRALAVADPASCLLDESEVRLESFPLFWMQAWPSGRYLAGGARPCS
jgi:hypothetical protein